MTRRDPAQADIARDDFLSGLRAWSELVPEEREKRAEAMRRIIEAKSNGNTSLSLANLELSSLPPQIGELTNLTELYLRNNKLTTLPEEIGNLTALKILNLNSNELTDLPEQIWDLTTLTSLALGNNRLTEISEQIGKLTALESLTIINNQLTTLPRQLSDLTHLKSLGISGNPLVTTPEQISNSTVLESLNSAKTSQQPVTQDPFVTGLQAWVDEATAPEGEREKRAEAMRKIIKARQDGSTRLSLSGLELSSLPAQIGDLNALIYLDLSYNQLTTLPESIGNLKALTSLDLGKNQLTELPESIGDLNALQVLYLSDNQLTELPERICDLTALISLYLRYNQLTSLPNSIFTNPARTYEINIYAENNRFPAAEALRLNALAQQNPLVRLGMSIHEPQVAARASASADPAAIINEIIKQSVEEAAVTESDFNMSRSILANTSLGGFHTFLGQCSRTASWQAGGEKKKNLCQALYGIMQKIDKNPDLAETVNLTSIGSDHLAEIELPSLWLSCK